MTLCPCNLAQCDSGIIHDDAGVVAYLAAAQRRCRTFLDRLTNKVMSVTGALQHDKELTGLDQTGIIVRS